MGRMSIALILALPLLARGDEKALVAEQKALAGVWVATGGEARGEKIAKDDVPLQWTFKAGGKAVLADRGTRKEASFTYVIDPSKDPKTIDVTYDGPEDALKNMKQLGIYKLDKDTLTLCLTMPGAAEKDRPKDFSTKGNRVLLMTFERAKDK